MLKTTSKRWLLLFIPFSIIITFQNCGTDNFEENGDVYASPFQGQIVQLSDDSFGSSSDQGDEQRKLSSEDGELKTIPGLEVVVVVNNYCAVSHCAEGMPNSDDSLSCYLLETQGDRRMLGMTQYYDFALPESMNSDQLDEYFGRNPIDQVCLQGVSNSHEYKISAVPDDTLYASHQKDYLDAINYEAGLDQFPNADLERIRVAVIDTGIGLSPDLNNVRHREDLRSDASRNREGCGAYSNSAPNHNHGTFVGSIIGATINNNSGIAGIASNVDLYSYTIGDCQGAIRTTEVANAITRALEAHEVDVINLSLSTAVDDLGVRKAIVDAMNLNVLVVASAGNDGFDLETNNSYPAKYSVNYTGVITVAATNADKTVASFSNFGPDYVSISAPGVNIASAYGGAPPQTNQISGDYGMANGTSFSAPIVTGAVALALGRLRRLNISYSMGYVKNLVTRDTAETVAGLSAVSENGSFLDLEALGTSINALENGADTNAISIVGSVSEIGNQPVLNLTINWDVDSIHPGARMAIFDHSAFCSRFTVECIIQDFDIDRLSGTRNFQLPLNAIAPMMPELDDPDFPIVLSAAIYYKRRRATNNSDGSPRYYSNLGIDARRDMNIRDVDGSDTDSALIGQVTSIRHDMVNAYIQGWACFEGDNDTVDVELRGTDGTRISSKFIYKYDYMVPHGSPIDGRSWPFSTASFGLADRPLEPTIPQQLYSRDSSEWVNVIHDYQVIHQAGTESNPQLIEPCKTLTGSHGFEFVVPLKNIQDNNFERFRVIANHRGERLRVQNEGGQEVHGFPQLTRFNDVSHASMNVDRTGEDFEITGTICAPSPSPVEVEVSYNWTTFRLALMDHTNPDGGSMGGFVNDPSENRKGFQHSYRFDSSRTSKTRRRITNYNLPEYEDSFTRYLIFDRESTNNFNPDYNVSVTCNEDPTYLNNINSRNFRQINTGAPVRLHCGQADIFPSVGTRGLASINDHSDYFQNNSSIITRGNSIHWDYYDVGESFSTFLVGYQLDTDRSVGRFINETYGIDTILREIKKFETPTSNQHYIFGQNELDVVGRCQSTKFRHRMNFTIEEYQKHSSRAESAFYGFWANGETPQIPSHYTLEETMARLPITLRFFQDGKLIKHIESDHQSNFVNVDYPFFQ